MKDPSPTAHLYRLGMFLVAALLVFLALAALLSPASWNYDMAYWHRADSLEEMKEQPLIYGGIEDIAAAKRNDACKFCHKAATKSFKKLKHKALSCEACHGALFDHVREAEKIAEAKIDRSTGQCLNCHDFLVNKPPGFSQFRTTEKYAKHRQFVAGEFKPGTTCLKCHDAHDPTP